MKRISLVLAACALATACSPQAEEPAVDAPEAAAQAENRESANMVVTNNFQYRRNQTKVARYEYS